MKYQEQSIYYYEILQTLEIPGTVYAGGRGELLAVRALPDSNGKNLIVVYKEISQQDGFVITAYLSNKIHELQKRTILWQRQN